jgi:hypothetical protein
VTVDIGAAPTTTAALLYAQSAQGGAPPDSDLQAALDELAAAFPKYETAEEYYEGTYGEYFASIRVRRAMARTGARFRLNFARSPVRAVADRLEVASVTCDDEEANGALQDVWLDNQMDLEMPDITEKASEYGDCYVIVWPTEPDDDHDDDYRADATDTFEGENAADLADTDDDGYLNVDMFYNSPMSVRLFYDPEKPRRKAFAIKRWMLSNVKRVRVDLYYPDRIERYISKPGVLAPKAHELEEFDGDDQDSTIDNPFGEIPVFHYRTARPYGRPVHVDFYGAQDAIHKLIISHMSGVDYQSLPQRYAIGAEDADSSEIASLDEDEFAIPLDTGATTHVGGDPQSQLSGEPGALWWLQRVKSVGQFAEADPDTFLKPIELYLRGGAQISETPMYLMDPEGQNPPSGEARRREDGPFTKKIRRLQLSFGATLRQQLEFALRIAGRNPDHPEMPGKWEHVKVDVQWKSPSIVDDVEGWQVVVAKINAGMPVKQAFLEAGYLKDQVDEWFGDDPGDDIPEKVDQLIKIAGALQAFSAAAATGMFSEEEIRTVIVAFLGEVGIDTGGETDGSPAFEPASGQGAPPPSLADDVSLGSR